MKNYEEDHSLWGRLLEWYVNSPERKALLESTKRLEMWIKEREDKRR